MKLASLWLLALALSCEGESFQALSVPAAADGGAGVDAPELVDAASRDVLADPWPDDVVIERAPGPIDAGAKPLVCCYGVAVAWGPCPSNIAELGAHCDGTCASWMPSGEICYLPGDVADAANACETCYLNGSTQRLLCCTHGQGAGSDCPLPNEGKGPVVHCADCPCH